jgi:glycosyltransferase involved in cell wall biosynthesis
MKDVTCGIKTLMRPKELRRLLDSIYSRYPTMPCVVVDDSREPSLDSSYPHWEHIKYIKLPFDTGLGAGRNAMIDAVDTKYCLYLDDDFVLCEQSRIDYFKAILDANIADIAGGQYREGKHFRKYHGLLSKQGDALVYRRKNKGEGVLSVNGEEVKYLVVDIVLNFFLGVTAVLRDVRWDDELKINTHTKFFYDAMQKNVRVVYCPASHVLHKQTRPKDYAKLRHRPFFKRMYEKVGITRVVKKGAWR